MDFNHLFPNSLSLLVSFETFAKQIIHIFEDKIKEPSCKSILQEMKDKQFISESEFTLNLNLFFFQEYNNKLVLILDQISNCR